MATKTAFARPGYDARSLGASLTDLARLVRRVHAAHVSRRELAELDPRMLRDIGLTEPQARAETQRAPWDLLPPPARPTPRAPRPDGAGWPAAIGVMLRRAWRRWRTRRSIADLDAHALRDIGVTFTEAENEANKPFWRR